jgi:acid phosphatase family membrane protein YuiD
MDIFSIDVTSTEIAFMRQALDLVQISGKDAKFLASLQIKLESEYAQIQEVKAQEESKKQAELQALKTKEKK